MANCSTGSRSTTVTFLPSMASWSADSVPDRPPPQTTTLSPTAALPVSTSKTWWTFSLSMPGIGRVSRSAPVATNTTSGFSPMMISAVASVLSMIFAPLSMVLLISQRRCRRISNLNDKQLISCSLPPSLSLFSIRMTSCPRSTSVFAAMQPATPPPTTTTLFLCFA